LKNLNSLRLSDDLLYQNTAANFCCQFLLDYRFPKEYFKIFVLLFVQEKPQSNPYPSGVSDEKRVSKNDQAEPPKGLGFPFGGAFPLHSF
jgi:hypothetical protein